MNTIVNTVSTTTVCCPMMINVVAFVDGFPGGSNIISFTFYTQKKSSSFGHNNLDPKPGSLLHHR